MRKAICIVGAILSMAVAVSLCASATNGANTLATVTAKFNSVNPWDGGKEPVKLGLNATDALNFSTNESTEDIFWVVERTDGDMVNKTSYSTGAKQGRHMFKKFVEEDKEEDSEDPHSLTM